jgi:hypothetical protein
MRHDGGRRVVGNFRHNTVTGKGLHAVLEQGEGGGGERHVAPEAAEPQDQPDV